MKEIKKNSIRNIAIMGLLIAIEIILSRFLSISTSNLKIGFGFVPLVLAGMMLGPIEAAIVAGAADFLGAILFPIGAYFPGFTLTAALTGLMFGLFLNKKVSILRIIGAVGINQFIIGLFINTYWISVLYGSPYATLFPIRAGQSVLLFVIQVVSVITLQEVLFNRMKTVFENA